MNRQILATSLWSIAVWLAPILVYFLVINIKAGDILGAVFYTTALVSVAVGYVVRRLVAWAEASSALTH